MCNQILILLQVVGQGIGRSMTGKLVRKTFGDKYVARSLQMAKGYEGVCVCVCVCVFCKYTGVAENLAVTKSHKARCVNSLSLALKVQKA